MIEQGGSEFDTMPHAHFVSEPPSDINDTVHTAVRQASESLLKLGASNAELAGTLARVISAVATEAARSSRLSKALNKALANPEQLTSARTSERPKRHSRRTPGVIDPFAIFADSGESGLRAQLSMLDLEQLRDIISEHGMDHDRLAMKWKDIQRVIDRIIERVESRVTKGSAFRAPPDLARTQQGETVEEEDVSLTQQNNPV